MRQENLKKITELRHQLHRYPELSMQERETKQRLIDFLKKETSLEVVDRGRWFYAVCRGRKNISALAFRADFDALPMEDRADLPYTSENPGISHRCGHDGHSAALAGLALELTPGEYEQDIYLIFQHGEEIGGGGEECAALIEEKGITKVFAFHNWSGFPEGSIVIKCGITQCASKGFTVSFTGTSAHASQPEDGKNPARACAELVLAVEDAAGQTDYEDLIMATIVEISVGSRNFGIAASEGAVSMTLRSGYDKDMNLLEQRIRESAVRLAERDGLQVEFAECDVFPETVNDSNCVELVRRTAAEIGLNVMELEKPFRASEDFGYYLKQCPGVMFYIGNGEVYPQIHTDGYDFNDMILKTAVDMFLGIVKKCNSD